MKSLTTLALLLLSLNAFSAEIKDCQLEGSKLKGIVTLNDAGNSSIQKILDERGSLEEKKISIKRVLYIETLSIGDGKSVCELAVKEYGVTEEKCLRVMKSSDIMDTILEDASDIDTGLDCRIGVKAKLLMQFNM